LLAGGDLLRKHVPGNTALVVTNETVAPLYLDRVVAALSEGGEIRVETVVLPDGEEHKNVDVLMKVFDKALDARLDRQTTFVALGGGVIGDMTGFAAASYQRGVHFVQIPTTVMAMVDSSVGGKTGVNHPAGKNMIGAFYQPRCVLVDTDTLSTLPDREYASGMAEVVKYGLIRDADFFEWQERNVDALMARDGDVVVRAIERSCVNKAEVVALDEKEGGVRATLNLGHTFGHAIETGIGYGEWLHGEAVSVGMVMAADMSERLGWTDESVARRTLDLLKKFNLPTDVPECMTVETFEKLMAVDKKAANGKLRLILLKGDLGGCVFTADFDARVLAETLDAYVRK
jgi:3-dehydroquinate synthase